MDDLEKLQDFEKTRGNLRLPLDIKPCITNLLNGSSPSANRGLNPFIIACELFRVGRDEKQIEFLLTKTNVKSSKIKSAIKSAVTGKYNFGCPRLEKKGLCVFESRFECWWYEKIPRQSQKKWRERDFWRYHWPHRLGNAKSMLYLALREVEKKRDYQAGARLFVSWDELQKVSAVSRDTIKPGLEALQKIGLIRYKPGQKRAKGSKGLASEISRVIPIPKSS